MSFVSSNFSLMFTNYLTIKDKLELENYRNTLDSQSYQISLDLRIQEITPKLQLKPEHNPPLLIA